MAKPAPAARPAAPAGLSTAMKRWWQEVVGAHELEPHRLRLLHLACQTWDRFDQARQIIAACKFSQSDNFPPLGGAPGSAAGRPARRARIKIYRAW